jgi:hypothetical protein
MALASVLVLSQMSFTTKKCENDKELGNVELPDKKDWQAEHLLKMLMLDG